MIRTTYPSLDALRRLPVRPADLVVILGALALLIALARIGSGTTVAFVPQKHLVPQVSLDPRDLPYYAARSVLRLFVALIWSVLFTFAYGYAAAHSRRAERVLIPLLDVLQSVPVLGFLTITVTGFIALFPGSLLGLEFASIFAIFTAQAWNMTFSFYQSLRSIPKELDEAAAMYGLSSWERFTKIEIPSGMVGMVWNGMMSFGGSWFFLAASEAITVGNQNYTLPGVGSYVAAAVLAKNVPALIWASATIAVCIVVIDQLFWRPVVAWADRFRYEQSAAAVPPSSWVYDVIRAAHLPALLARAWAPAGELFNRAFSRITAAPKTHRGGSQDTLGYRIYNVAVPLAILAIIAYIVYFLISMKVVADIPHVLALGLFTMLRVFILIAFSTLVWVPLGVAIGFHPRLARALQPVVQFLASFPANIVFPFATLAFITYHIPINWGCIVLMALGAQWYVLFNTIAGAQSIPTELREMTSDLEVTGWLRWKRLIIPGVFASWVTGAITASGGAWNASIVSEVVSWGDTTLTAAGLGAYITEATAKGDGGREALGIVVMSIFVVIVNRLLWRRLYDYAKVRFAL
ncbi:MAG TPA: ABC transporter permease subunit [Candidatus Acidoferrum sp.]|nr:ABC transporter permease subunit [Candidatus Acidoferrum sp.]